MSILCRNCGREIDFSEKNYSIDGEIHCPRCVEKRLVKVYVIDGDIWDSEDVDYYVDKEDYIKEKQRRVDVLENKKAPLQYHEMEKLETLQEELRELLGE